jgi:ArsR family transcriptional regulator, cadmium/lead-responsive transcriptional repressor
MRRQGGEVDELWAAVVDPTRRRLLDVLLAQREATATTLARELPVTRQAVAKHLAVLDRAGLVQRGRQGREVRYVVRPERLDAAARSMAKVAAEWDERLTAIKRIAESSAREQSHPRATRPNGARDAARTQRREPGQNRKEISQ